MSNCYMWCGDDKARYNPRGCWTCFFWAGKRAGVMARLMNTIGYSLLVLRAVLATFKDELNWSESGSARKLRKKKKNISTDVLRTVRTRGWWSALSNCYWSLLMRWIQGWALIFGVCQSCFAAMSVLDRAPCWSALCPARLRPQWTSDLPCHWAIADTTNHHRYSWPLLLPSTAFHFSLGLLAVSVLGCHQDRGRCFWCQDRRETSPLVYILYTCHFI